MKAPTSLISLSLALCCSAVVAQPGSRQGGSGFGGGGSRPGTPGSATLEATGLKVGQKLPELTVFDENGGKFRLADIKGKHTVVVFGCIT
ncbi:MAG: hypothetical protein AB8B50_12295 [Pirellulaceae bacterium]